MPRGRSPSRDAESERLPRGRRSPSRGGARAGRCAPRGRRGASTTPLSRRSAAPASRRRPTGWRSGRGPGGRGILVVRDLAPVRVGMAPPSPARASPTGWPRWPRRPPCAVVQLGGEDRRHPEGEHAVPLRGEAIQPRRRVAGRTPPRPGAATPRPAATPRGPAATAGASAGRGRTPRERQKSQGLVCSTPPPVRTAFARRPTGISPAAASTDAAGDQDEVERRVEVVGPDLEVAGAHLPDHAGQGRAPHLGAWAC